MFRSVIISLTIIFVFCVLSIKPAFAITSGDFQEVTIDNASSGTPNSPWGKGVGDIDGDGILDLLIGSRNGGGLVWYQNPTWQKHQINTGPHSTDIEVADIDNDGDNDVAVVTDTAIRWYRNLGSGTSWTAITIANRVQHDLELADFNQDGLIDIATRNQGGDGNILYVYLQGAGNSFSEQSRSDLPSGEGLLVKDIDGDGDPDIIWNSLWLENTGGNLSTWILRTYASSWHPSTFIASCDINQDNRPDIILSPSEFQGGNYRISYFIAPPDPISSNWTEVVVDPSVETVQHFVGCGDMDGDGDIDITAAEMQQGNDPDEIKIYENLGNHTTFSKVVISTGGSHSMRVVDINGDGKLDLFGANWNGVQPVKIWFNHTQSPTLPLTNWTYIQPDSNRASRKFGLTAGDLTNDSLLEIISGQYVYSNPGGNLTGSWARTTLPDSSLDALLTLDVDSDNLGDVIAMNNTGNVYWLEATNTQATSWTQTLIGNVGSSDEGISTQGYAIAQLVSGGKPEIIINVANKLSFFEIPGSPAAGNWPNQIISTIITSEPEGVATGDIDQDGDIDIASVINGTQVAWWSNPEIGGGGWIQHNLGTLPSTYGDRLHLADFDGDGDLDLAITVANGSANGVYWFQSPANPANTWTRTTILSAGTNPAVDTMNSMDVADMDRDGDPDIITAEHRGGKRVFILENNGSGSFTTHTISTGIENHLGSRVFDLDQDGDLDIIGIAWDNYQDLHIWRNDALSGGILPTPTPSGPSATPTVAGPSPTPLPTIPAGTNLVAYYPFEEGAGDHTADSTGNHSAAQLFNTIWDAGKYGTGLGYNGTNAYTNLGNWNISENQLTVATWIKASAFSSPYHDNRIISKASGQAEQDHDWMLSTINNSVTTLRFRLKTDGVTSTLIGGTNQINLNQWHHVAATYDGTQMRLYLDGVSIGSMAKSGSINTSANHIFVGANPPDTYSPWIGTIDEVIIYNTALSLDAINSLMQHGPGTVTHGDTDYDNDVDSLDFLRVIQDFLSIVSSPADFNTDGIVDIFDFNILVTHFGS
jgi:hypothetical protein